MCTLRIRSRRICPQSSIAPFVHLCPCRRWVNHRVITVETGGCLRNPGFSQVFSKNHGLTWIYRGLIMGKWNQRPKLFHVESWDWKIHKDMILNRDYRSSNLTKYECGRTSSFLGPSNFQTCSWFHERVGIVPCKICKWEYISLMNDTCFRLCCTEGELSEVQVISRTHPHILGRFRRLFLCFLLQTHGLTGHFLLQNGRDMERPWRILNDPDFIGCFCSLS